MESSRRRRVTLAQLESLWELLNLNKSLATGFNKSAQARADAKNMWMRAAELLNSHGDGAVKDWKGWCKYWNDYKSKIKIRLSSLRASNARTGGGPPDAKPLTEVEKKFVLLLGDDFGSGLAGARVEPFHYETQMETQPGTSASAVHHSLSPPLQVHMVADQTPSTSSQSLLYTVDIVPITIPPPITSSVPNVSSTPSVITTPPPITSSVPNVPSAPSVITNPTLSPNRPPLSPVTSVAETHTASRLVRTPQRSPRRRRRRLHQRETPLTQDMARRQLIQQSERRLVNEEALLELLRTLVEEIREIKNILCSRQFASARDVL